MGSFLPTVTFYNLKLQKTPIWQRVAGAPPWGLTNIWIFDPNFFFKYLNF